jgi:outer membrane protein OmpA-like peptidoglycan-associated protein
MRQGRVAELVRARAGRLACLCMAVSLAFAADAGAADPAGVVAAALPRPHDTTLDLVEPVATYPLPIGAWQASGLPVQVLEGRLRLATWRVADMGLSTAQLLAALREGLLGSGFVPVFECAGVQCGGFDFRFATRIAPEPEMHVNIADFRYLAAARPDPRGEGTEYLSLIASRSRTAGFVQMIHVAAATDHAALREEAPPTPVPVPAPADRPGPAAPPPAADIAARLGAGPLVLEEIAFAPGSAEMDATAGDDVLASIATHLAARPALRLIVVGHTDATGTLESNVALSRARAEAVRARLIGLHGVEAAQVIAEGAGFLAPRADNTTAEGRAANRRVEVFTLEPAN